MFNKFKEIAEGRRYDVNAIDTQADFESSNPATMQIIEHGRVLEEFKKGEAYRIIGGIYNDIERQVFEDAKKGDYKRMEEIKGLDLLFKNIDDIIKAAKHYASLMDAASTDKPES